MARLFDASKTNQLRPWLIKALEPICDADPAVLSEYVLALLKHDTPEPELRSMFVQQLQDFLEKEAEPFVEKLFHALRSRSYIPYEDQSSESGIHIPLDALVTSPKDTRGTKRPADFSDEPGRRPPPKGPRLSDPGRNTNGRNSGPQNSRGGPRHSIPGRNGSFSGPAGTVPQRGPPGAGSSPDRGNFSGQAPKELCPDYHTVGFCPRGELCPFTHGDEAIVPPMPFSPGSGPNAAPNFNPMQLMNFMQNGFPMPWMVNPSMGGAYDPNEARMDISMPGPDLPRGPRRGSRQFAHTDAVDLTSNGRPPPERREHFSLSPPPPMQGPSGPFPPQNGFVAQPPAFNDFSPSDVTMSAPNFQGPSFPSQRGNRGGRGGGRGVRGGDPGRFPSGDAHFRESSGRHGDSKTIVVEKIPPESLTLGRVNDWFQRFGTVTNVAIDAPTQKALVSFQTHEDAHRAWKSEEAIFGNRFVKVFWHRPLAGQGEAGTKALAASAPLIQNMSANPAAHTASTSTKPIPQSTPAAVAHDAQALLARSQLLERQIAEQKALMAKLSSASPEEKQDIMSQLRKLSEEMKNSSPSPASTLPSPAPPAVAASTSSSSALPPGNSANRQSQIIKERLDRELELHSAQGALATADTDMAAPDDPNNRTSELMAQVEELRKKAAEVGVPTNEIHGTAEGSFRGGRGFPRGRARGRGTFFPRGRGGAVAKSLKLDNRTRKLIAKGLNIDDEKVISAAEEWFKSVGELESFQVSGTDEVHVQYKTRGLAEFALAQGTNIPNVGQIQLSWHSPPRPLPPVSRPVAPLPNSSNILPVSDPSTSGKTEADSVPALDETTSAAVEDESSSRVDGPRERDDDLQRQDDDDGWGDF